MGLLYPEIKKCKALHLMFSMKLEYIAGKCRMVSKHKFESIYTT